MTSETEVQVPEEQQIDTQSRRRFLQTVGGAAAAGLAIAGTIGYVATRGPGTTDKLVAGYRAGDLPDDPTSSTWLDRDPFVAAMLPQNMATPLQTEVDIAELRVRALHNGTGIAFHLQWDDDTEDAHESLGQFRDAVAVMLEVDPATTPSFTMGNTGAPVHILQWRASWQADIDEGHQGVKQLFPNAYNDVSPEMLMPKEQAIAFYPARVSNNSQSNHERTSPVEEYSAIGFGSLTSHTEQQATGSGVYRARRWQVVISWPMTAGDSTKSRVEPGETRNVAFAVWNGDSGQRGGRKQYAPWAPIEVEATE
ncbi:MAG: ethylbenzene dehydrogenase-related protein [Dehalococcoidia bacterium]